MDILRYVAFSADPNGGNPAGVILDAAGATDAEMLAVAAEIGYSETAFVVGVRDGAGRELDVRYFSPLAEVSFCGHATIAAAVAYADRHGAGDVTFHIQAGPVPIHTRVGADGAVVATLTSVPPHVDPLAAADLAEILAALGWTPDDLDPGLPPRVAYAGAFHPIIAVASRDRLARLDYDFERLGALLKARDWTTVDLVFRADEHTFHVRNPFPPGGVVEDPATGAAAAAFGGYLRELGLVATPAEVRVCQGHDMGRPGTLLVRIAADAGSGIEVEGTAVAIG